MKKPILQRQMNCRCLKTFILVCLLVIIGVSANAANFTVSTEAEFDAAYASSTTNDVIILTNNIVVTTEKILSKSITINGNGFTISLPNPGLDDMGRFNTAASGFRVFTISDNSEVTVHALTIKGGGSQGAIYVDSIGILHMNECVVSNSKNSRGGGGIVNRGLTYLNNLLVNRNAAQYGGGFLNSGIMFIENSTFSENRSTSSVGGGGAGENQGYLYINNSTISNNQSTEIGGGINNRGTICILNSNVTGNVCYGDSKGGGIGNNGVAVYAINTLFAYNYSRTGGDVTNPTSYQLDDIIAYSNQRNVCLYNCIYHAALPAETSDKIGNIHYTGLADGSDNTIFTGGSSSNITDGTGVEIGTAKVFRPYLKNYNGCTVTALKTGSFVLKPENRGTQTRFANNNNVSLAIAYYNTSSSSWVDLKGTSTASELISIDQVGTTRSNPPAIGAIQGVTDNLYLVKVNAATNGSVNGGTLYGDVYAAGSSVNLTAIPDLGYHFVRWDYMLGGSGIASTSNPYTFSVTSDLTLSPVFDVNTANGYSITYIGNNNTSGDAPEIIKYSTPTTIAGPGTLNNTDYSFDGWNTNANGSGISYAVGSTYSQGANLTLYAMWTQNSSAPTVTTDAATNITATAAMLNGSVNANNYNTTVSFEYGVSTSYGSRETLVSTVTGTSATPVSYTLTGLIPNTTYHYRVNGVNSRGTSNASDMTFTTLDIAPHISYLTPLTYTVGIPITALIPTNTGGAVPAGGDSDGFIYTVSPTLPTGLSFDRTTGTINGTPTVLSAATMYTVTAANSGGLYATSISITVKNPQTITFSALPTKTYGDAPYDLTATTSSGLGLSYSSDNSAVATVSGTTIIIVGAGIATITVSQAGDATYTAAPNITQQLTVNKKALMVTARIDTKTYDGTTASTLTPIVGTLVAGDLINVSPTQVFDHATVGIRVLTASGLTIKNSSTDVTGNYDISYTSATGTINKFSLSVTAIADTKTYDGTTASTRTPIVGTLVAGDLINVSPTQAFDNATVGTRVLTASGLIIKNSNTDVTGNYNIQYIAVNGSISAKILTIKEPVVTLNKDYDGTTLATVTVGALSGVVARDEGNIAVTAAANYDNATVGVNKTIRVIYTLVGSAANNYIAPADYVIAGARILETIKLNLLSTPTPGCEGTDMQLAYSVLSGTPTQYKINFDAAAQTAGMQNVNYTNLISFGENGVVSFTLPTKIKYGTYHGTLQMKSEFGKESSVYNFQFTIKVSSDYIIPKFDDVLLCDNSSNTFTAYQWYKDGVAIAGATEQFYNDHILDGSYSLKLTTTDGKTVYSCDKVLTASKAKKVNAYPSPLKVSEICTVKMIGFSIEDLEGASLSVYTTQGICVYHSTKVENVNLISLPPMAGMYLGSVVTEKGQRTQFKIIVVG